jgi:putative sterol carrier protein
VWAAQLNPPQAFMSGKVKAKGNLSYGLKLSAIGEKARTQAKL